MVAQSYNPQNFAVGDTDYVEKLNSNNSSLKSILNPMSSDIDTIKNNLSTGIDLDLRQQAFNFIVNGSLDYFQRGNSLPPDGFVKQNVVGIMTVSKDNTDVILNTNNVKIDGEGQLAQSLKPEFFKNIDSSVQITVTMWGKTSNDNNLSIGIFDGIVTLLSTPHAGNNEWELLSVTKTFDITPSDLKLVIDSSGLSECFCNSITLIRGNPSQGALPVVNDPYLEKLRVLALYEKGSYIIDKVGTKSGINRVARERINFCVPKYETPSIIIDDSLINTGFDLQIENITKCGFDVVVTDLGGETGTDGIFFQFDWEASS